MSSDVKARNLIQEFAPALLALFDGKKIPEWCVIALKKALRPKDRQRGRRIDEGKIFPVVKALTLVGNAVTKPRTKLHNPATIKRRIAQEAGVCQKTVERRLKVMQSLQDNPLPSDPKKREMALTVAGAQILTEFFAQQDREHAATLHRTRTQKR